jgi:hypothetical protein
VNAAELTQALFAAKDNLDKAMRTYEEAIAEDADADRAMKLAMSTAYVTLRSKLAVDNPKVPVAEVEAHVTKATLNEQHRARLAEGLKRSAGKAVDAAEKWMGALQSIGSLSKAEATIAAYEPSATRSA